MTLDKLEGIRSDITRMDPKWKDWGFHELLEAPRGWIDRNPLQIGERDSRIQPRDFKREHFQQGIRPNHDHASIVIRVTTKLQTVSQ